MKTFKQIRQINSHYINEAVDMGGIEGEIHRKLDSKNHEDRISAAAHTDATHRNLRKALDDVHSDVRITAASHGNASSQNLIKALKDHHPNVRIAALRNPNVGVEHLIRGLDDPHKDVRKKSLSVALNHPDIEIRKAAIRRLDVTPNHIDRALEDSHNIIRYYAARHQNASPENLKKASQDPDPNVREAAKRGIKEAWDQDAPPKLRLIKTHTGPKGHVAKVYRDKDWDEYRVKFFSPSGEHHKNGDYHTSDKEDANDTAASEVIRGYHG